MVVIFRFKNKNKVMCILLSYVAKRISPGEFKLILVSNRDEYHHRPSKPANFISENVLYGKLNQPVRFVPI